MHQQTILIIDDDVSIRDSLSAFFEDEGYQVLTAENGRQGMAVIDAKPVDLVLTDLRMPEMDGLEVMQAIHGRRPDLPMIVISGAGDRDDIILALRMGARDYITKPVSDLDMIGHTVRQALETRRLTEENRQYRIQLEKNEKKYRTITENIAEGVFTMDAHEKFTYVNQAFGDMIGHPGPEILGKHLRDLTTETNFSPIRPQLQTNPSEMIGRYEIEFIHQNQTRVHTEMVCTPVFDESGQYQGIIAIARDITRISALKKQLREYLQKGRPGGKGVVPICAGCKSIRINDETWLPVEAYFSHIQFSHGICPECCEKLYPEFNLRNPEADD